VPSNHNPYPGLPPLDGHGAGDSADPTGGFDVTHGTQTAQHARVRAQPPHERDPRMGVDPQPQDWQQATAQREATVARPWPPSPAAIPATGIAGGQWSAGTTSAHASVVRSVVPAVAERGDATGWSGGGDIASGGGLAEICQAEYERIRLELNELRLAVQQFTTELESSQSRQAAAAARIREMEDRLEMFARQEIRDAYLAFAQAEMHAFMINEQREQLANKLRNHERYLRMLRRTLDALAVPSPAADVPSARERVERLTGVMPAVPAVPVAATLPGFPALPEVSPFETGHHPMPAGPAPAATAGGQFVPGQLRVFQVQESLRVRIAQRLHDGLAQSLANIVLSAEICEKLMGTDVQRALAELAGLKAKVSETLQETRRFIFELRPMTLTDLGLYATLRRYADEVAAAYHVVVPVSLPQTDRRLAPQLEVALFRVAQEALLNAVEHGHATQVRISVALEPDAVTLVVEDTGQGFDVEPVLLRARAGETVGIASMQQRAELLGGWLRIESTPGRGTRIELRVPQ
jgi:two-component system sensor histidine kinase DegS